MRFIYPAVIKELPDGRFHARFPDLEMCEAEGATLDLALREAKAAAWSWVDLEFTEEDPKLPPASDPEDLTLEEGEFVRNILIIYRVHEGWDE
ncbi:MAG: type II toxin-antitoxin system HicB family antitoxin [Lachnospiraceae bacterium]|nr:type II toxin-antitoxin system HicB family antitoxin [Lachnospiraceae bacterium]